MDISLFGKIGIIFKYIFSSFMSVEMLLLNCLLLFVLLYNIKIKNKYINIGLLGIYLGLMLGIVISYSDYVQLCIDGFVKTIISYIYFPPTIIYFLTFIFITILMIYTIFNKRTVKIKRIVNYICFSILYFLFVSYVVICVCNGIDIYNTVMLYSDETILAIVQVSNLIFIVWLVFTAFYELYIYLRKKYD